MRKVYFPEPEHLKRRCLGNDKRLRELDLTEVDSPREADLIAVARPENLTPDLLALDRLNLVWTEEPFHSNDRVPMIVRHGKPIHIFNVFNMNVLTDNFYFVEDAATWERHGPGDPDSDLRPIDDESDCNVPFDNKRIITMMTRRTYSMMHEGVEYALSERREKIAIAGSRLGKMDVYGRGWPGNVSSGDSRRQGDWRAVKIAEFRRYNFVFCPENCIADFYLTEKIWDAIRANCLPIYGGSSAALGTFPAGSFVEMQAFKNPKRLFAFLEAMSFEEYRRRLNVLKEVYRNAVAINARKRSRARTFRIIRAFLDAQFAVRPPVGAGNGAQTPA